MHPIFLLSVFFFSSILADNQIKVKALNNTLKILTTESPINCICGIFLNGEFKKDNKESLEGNPALIHGLPGTFPCTPIGNKICISKCLDTVSYFTKT